MTTTQIDQINRLKKDLKLTKERCEDLANELQQKDNQLIQMEAVCSTQFLKFAHPSRKETLSERGKQKGIAKFLSWIP